MMRPSVQVKSYHPPSFDCAVRDYADGENDLPSAFGQVHCFKERMAKVGVINAKVPPWTIGNLQVKNNFSHSESELDKNCGAASVRWLKRMFGFMNWNDKVIWPP